MRRGRLPCVDSRRQPLASISLRWARSGKLWRRMGWQPQQLWLVATDHTRILKPNGNYLNLWFMLKNNFEYKCGICNSLYFLLTANPREKPINIMPSYASIDKSTLYKDTMSPCCLNAWKTALAKQSLIHLLLHIVDAQPGDDIHIHRPVPVGFQMVVKGLRLVAGLVEEIGQSGQHTWQFVGQHLYTTQMTYSLCIYIYIQNIYKWCANIYIQY